jgi:hypothetical protein
VIELRSAARFSIAVCATASLTACATNDARLEGKWKSNKALTVATMGGWRPSGKSLSAAKRAKFASLFGKLVVTYHRGTVTIELPSPDGQPPFSNSHRFRLVASDDDSVAYVSENPLTHKKEISHLHFDGQDRYWIYLHGTGMKEYFDRIAP